MTFCGSFDKDSLDLNTENIHMKESTDLLCNICVYDDLLLARIRLTSAYDCYNLYDGYSWACMMAAAWLV